MIFELLFLSSGFNVIVIALVLIHKRLIPEPGINRLFVFMLVCMFAYSILALIRFFAVNHHLNNLLTYYLPIDDIAFSLVSPALYLFTKSILRIPYKLLSYKSLLHLLPGFMFFLYVIYFILQDPVHRMNFLHENFKYNTITFIVINCLIYVQVIIYLSLSYLMILRQMRVTSLIEFLGGSYDISWLKPYVLSSLIYTLITIPFYIYLRNEEIKIIIIQIGLEIQFLYFFIRWTFNIEGALFKYNSRITASRIAPDMAASLLIVIEAYMKEHKPYLNEKCTIQTLSNNTGLTIHQISGVINCTLKKSFSDYINEYRINDAISQLLSSKSESNTIEGISMDCGFGSKSTFNRAFKKFTNLTPTEYLQKHK